MGRQSKLAAQRRSDPDRTEAERILMEQIRKLSSEMFEMESMLRNCRPRMIEGNEGSFEEDLNQRDDFENLLSALPSVERELSDYLTRTKNAALAAFQPGAAEKE